MGFFDQFTNIFTGKPAVEAANQNKALFNENYGRGIGQLETGFAGSKEAYGKGIEAYQPLSALAGQFGQGTNMYTNSLGLGGAAGNDAARSAFQAGPGYEYARNQALESSTRGAAARGGGIGGNQLAALSTLGSNLGNQEFGGWQNKLQGLSQQQLQAQNAASGGIAGQYGNLAGANMTHGQNLVNLGNTTASANANANNTSAQAQMQGSGNLWNMGLNAAKMAFGMPPMGGGGSNNNGNFFNPVQYTPQGLQGNYTQNQLQAWQPNPNQTMGNYATNRPLAY